MLDRDDERRLVRRRNSERKDVQDIIRRLDKIETRLSRIEGGLVLGGFVIGALIPLIAAGKV